MSSACEFEKVRISSKDKYNAFSSREQTLSTNDYVAGRRQGCLSYIVNTIAADDMEPQAARPSAAVIMS